MQEISVTSGSPPILAAICVDGDVLNRWGRVLRHLVVGLVDEAIQIRLLSSDPRIEGLALGPAQTVLHSPMRRTISTRRLEPIIEELSAQPPDLVHAFSSTSYPLAATLAEAWDAELVYTISSPADCQLLKLVDLSRIDQCVAVSEPLVIESEKWVEEVELIRPGLLAARQAAFRAGSDREPTVVCAAPLDAENRADRVIEALALLGQWGCQPLAFFLGEGRQESSLRRLGSRLGLSSRLTFAHPAGDATAVLHSADVFVQPAVEEAFRVDSLAALAAGLAVVTVPTPMSDHIQDGVTAVMCHDDTPHSLADSIGRVLTDHDFGRRIAEGGLEHVRSRHAVSTMSQRTGAIYRRLAMSRATYKF